MYVVIYNNRYELLSKLKMKCGIEDNNIISEVIEKYEHTDYDTSYEMETVQPCKYAF